MKTKYLCMLLPVLLSGCAPSAQTYSTSLQRPSAVSTPNKLDGGELKKIGDIDQRLNTVKDTSVEGVAKAIEEVDEWFFIQKDEGPARERIEIEIEKLRTQIEKEITALLNEALMATHGKTASEKMIKVNTILSFYPAPRIDEKEKQERLKEITSKILSTSKRVEDIRRLRYNEKAISWIKHSLEFYRNGTKTFPINSPKASNDELINECVRMMSPIDTAFLEPVVMDLYNYVYGLFRDKVSKGDNDNYRIKLTNGFANPSTKRLTPSDF